jgi:hypothetical protein
VTFRRNRTEESTARAGNEAQSNWATEPPPEGRGSLSQSALCRCHRTLLLPLLGSAVTATACAGSSMALDQVTNHAGQTALHVRPGRSADLVHLRRRSVHSHRVERDVQRPRPEARGPRPEALCAPVALGEAAIVRRGGHVTVIGRGPAIPDSRAGRGRALGIAQLNATFTKTQGVMLSFRAFTDNSFKMLMLIRRYRSRFKS